jgi:spore photoproduct lyase
VNSIVRPVTRKTFKFRYSGRSSDYIAPSFGFGCLYECAYCYMKRHKPTGLDYATNIDQILTEINSHAAFADVEKPNQTHQKYVTYDISCNEDFALHSKYYDWKKIFSYFRDHPTAMATLATKHIPEEFLEFDPKGKVRIRFSLMPENIRKILEPNTKSILRRIKAINDFKKAGYDVHINFSPVVVYDGWLDDYSELFALVNGIVDTKYKPNVLSEVIFLTHNIKKHVYNVENNILGEDLIWTPHNQEGKVSNYGGDNLRYSLKNKVQYINEFKKLHNSIIKWNKIRYIF